MKKMDSQVSLFHWWPTKRKKKSRPTISLRRLSSAALLLASSLICKQMREHLSFFRFLLRGSEKYWSARSRTLTYCFLLTYMWTIERKRTRLCLVLTQRLLLGRRSNDESSSFSGSEASDWFSCQAQNCIAPVKSGTEVVFFFAITIFQQFK